MLDLVLQDSLEGVPVPLPGRVIVFADENGALRARRSDTSVMVLEAGPRGERGEQGLQGLQGVPGATGAKGADAVIVVPDVGDMVLLNGWSNRGGSEPVAAYWRDQFGMVHLTGVVWGGAIGSIIGTLPVGYRPAGALQFATVSGGAFGVVTVGPLGNVSVVVGASVYVSLIGLSFRGA